MTAHEPRVVPIRRQHLSPHFKGACPCGEETAPSLDSAPARDWVATHGKDET